MYVDLKSCIRKRFSCPDRTRKVLKRVNRPEKRFRLVAFQLFRIYQPLGTRVSHWQVLSNVFDVITHVGALNILVQDVSKVVIRASRDYIRKNKKLRTAMTDTLENGFLQHLRKSFFRRVRILWRNIQSGVKFFMENRTLVLCNGSALRLSCFKKRTGLNMILNREEVLRDAFGIILYSFTMVCKMMDWKHFLIFMNILKCRACGGYSCYEKSFICQPLHIFWNVVLRRSAAVFMLTVIILDKR